MRLVSKVRFALRALSLRSAPSRPLAQTLQEQEQRLRALLIHAVRLSPFYARKYRGLDVGRCALTDLPPTNKKEIMEHLDEVLTDRRLSRHELERFLDNPDNRGEKLLDEYAVSHTSGSSGQPLILVQDRCSLELLFALQASRGNVFTAPPALEAVRRMFTPVRLAVILMKAGFYPSVSAFDHMPAGPDGVIDVMRVAPTDRDLLDRLNDFRPNALLGYASVLDTLAVSADRLRLAPDLKQITNISEELTPQTRQRLHDAFHVPILDTYSSGECPFLSNGCRAGPGSHVNADWAILESVDAQGQPVEPDTPGEKVYVTNLANRVQPFIRYEMRDRVTITEARCGCGNQLPRVASVAGRSDDVLWVRDGGQRRKVMGEVFLHALEYSREVREWQAIQEEPNRVRLRLELLPGADLNREKIRRSLNEQLSMFDLKHLIDIQLETVPAIRPDPKTGKLNRLVSRVGSSVVGE
jgi:phenylacetate-coenzyme A ligase PaaK-like adenylate-forming protein